MVKKENTSSIFEEVLKEVLSEFDRIVSPHFIDENIDTFRNLVQNDSEILIRVIDKLND